MVSTHFPNPWSQYPSLHLPLGPSPLESKRPNCADRTLHADPELWEDPDVFRPERWLEKPDAPLFTFGLGYRMCAGHLLAAREVYLIFMRLLASFRLEQVPGVEMAEVDPASGFKNPRDLIMAPLPYELLCVPRDETRLKEVLAEVDAQDVEKV